MIATAARTRFARRLMVGVTAAIATFSIGAIDVAKADTATTGTGGYVSGWGYCGGYSPGFWLDSAGIEELRIIKINLYTNRWDFGAWTRAPQRTHQWYSLPIGAPDDVYIVEGRDYTTSGTVSVATYVSFTQIPSFNVFYWC